MSQRGQLPPAEGLYDPAWEHDACGAGFVADMHGRRSHAILEQAIEAVIRVTHRGAMSADRKSGDGAGIMTQLPYALMRKTLVERGLDVERDDDLAVGVFFFEPDGVEAGQAVVDAVVDASGVDALCWREVPVDMEALGDAARESCPAIWHLLMQRPEPFASDPDDFERHLFLTRRRIEQRAQRDGVRFYIPSFSHRTLVYKGLMLGPQLHHFYTDLAEPDYETAIALFHQRFSTNTFPTWHLAQPLRMLAQNGEINTLHGNVNWMKAREGALTSPLWRERLGELFPIIQEGGSDSSMLDNAFELLVLSGRTPLHAMTMLVPEAHDHIEHLDPAWRAFLEYHATLSEPWDGPAALVFSDGRYAAAALDRNGLRPLRYWICDDGTVIAGSEAGLVPEKASRVVEKGRLGPGKMIAVATHEGRILRSDDIQAQLAARRPYAAWLEEHRIRPTPGLHGQWRDEAPTPETELTRTQKVMGYAREDTQQLIEPMIYDAKGAVGSMGDDTPIAALSRQPQQLYRYFKQRFAQVTNPPIDPLRERLVMSLRSTVGPRQGFLEERPEAAHLVELSSPILSEAELRWLTEDGPFLSRTLQVRFRVEAGLEGLHAALEELCCEAEAAADDGVALLVLSDRGVDAEHAPVPMLLATAAIHQRLIRAGKRFQIDLICDTGEPREDHHVACLLGFGASLVHPWLAYESARALAASDPRGEELRVEDALSNLVTALEKGLLKIMSKMGISDLSSYRGAQIFEALGLDSTLVDAFFTGTPSRIGGVGLETIARDVLTFHSEAYGEHPRLVERGIYRYRRGGEFHAFNPPVFKALHKAVRKQSQEHFDRYAKLNDERPPCNLRDLLRFREADTPIPLSEVEPAEAIARRFCTQAMSHGALSRETHELLGIAMNRIGGKSNSGEGGEAQERFRRYDQDRPDLSNAPYKPRAGDWGNSAIKQVASGRFGVTPSYLISAQELEIKMAQGSKPGEGGQLPGHKVTEEIARIRRSTPGVTLISPPPHHDIYSIEDLSQLIYDLKRVNRDARVCVKLVAVGGVGTIAAGVAKGYADTIQISGHDGGTGASPLSSIKHAGLPIELGLSEVQQVLVKNNLRGRVKLRADSGMKTGRDVVMAALMGAEEFGFGTAALVAAGCVMARRCHLDSCPVGVATQRPELRARFPGTPEHVIAFMMFVAEQVRHLLARLGVRSLQSIIGRTDLLEARDDIVLMRSAELDLSAILHDPDPSGQKPRRCVQPRNDRPEDAPPLDEELWLAARPAIEAGAPFSQHHPINNRERSVGARLAGEIARRFGDAGLPESAPLALSFEGSAGQSFGAFALPGMRLELTGEAQDYVGKGLGGGTLVLRPPAHLTPHDNVIMGNTVLYGATGGALFASGIAGERLAVRNSGAQVVVEGCGDHGCEYMTGGVAVILGRTGRNFGAGMSGGVAYVLDQDGHFADRVNPGMVELVELGLRDQATLRALIERHHEATGSPRAATLLKSWGESLGRFRKVSPRGAARRSAQPEETQDQASSSVAA